MNLRSFIICPQLIVCRENKVLLLRRMDWAPIWPDHWHLPTGKIEDGESPRQTIIRESYEEVGVIVEPDLATIVAVTAWKFDQPKEIYHDICLFFVAKDLKETPINKEPHLHSAMDWFDIHNLPEMTIPVVKHGLDQYMKGILYGEVDYR